MAKKVVIIGGVAGGASCAARLRRLDETAEIVLLERGAYISYANCGLPYHVGDVIKSRSALLLQTPEAMNQKFNVDVRVKNEVVAINRDTKTVTVRRGETGETYEESYDKLILSPGAEPFVPPIEGAKSDKVFTLRNIPDTYRIKDGQVRCLKGIPVQEAYEIVRQGVMKAREVPLPPWPTEQ